MCSTQGVEQRIQQEIESHLNSYSSICFNAGAGSGKTYALVEGIQYLLKNKLTSLKKGNQKILCITYTNVATDEISRRIGKSDTVLVSTIHERLWDMVRLYQRELILIHKQKLKSEIERMECDLTDKDSNCRVYATLNESDRQNFSDYMSSIKEIYYENYNKPALNFRNTIKDLHNLPLFIKDMLNNVANFKKITKYIYNIKNYRDCINKIESGENNELIYSSLSNQDRLHRMQFSHNTLLKYTEKLISEYPKLQRILIDRYPYVFIDEYQDTSEEVVNIFRILNDFAQQYSKNFFVGYFGDIAQNIYDDGVGDRINELHPGLVVVNKEYNRRSANQIINVINKVRNDKIEQKSINDKNEEGLVEFYHYNTEVLTKDRVSAVNNFLNNYLNDLVESSSNIEINTKIDCLVLTHKSVSQFYGFSSLFDLINNAGTIYHNDFSVKFLSNDLKKLDDNIIKIYRLLSLKRILMDGSTSYQDILGKENSDISFYEAKKSIDILQNSLHAENINELIENISALWQDNIGESLNINKFLECCFNYILNLKSKDLEKFGSYKEYMLYNIKNLMLKDSDLENNENLENFEKLMSLNLEEWFLWYDYINRSENLDASASIKNIRFHTYHGTKGAEFKNVAIILEKGFGARDKSKFVNYFKSMNKEIIVDKETCSEYQKKLKTRNLLYVAFSRAITNLRILYLDDVSEFQDSLVSLFGQVEVLE